MSYSGEDTNSDLDNLITKIGDLDLQDTFVNLKPDIIEEKPEWNPNISDIPSTSRRPNIRQEKPNSKSYAGIYSSIKQENYTPYEKMKGEPINPFGIYLDVDCITNVEEAIDKWETAIRIAITVNKMDVESIKHFIERSLVNSALRFWQNLNEETKTSIFDDNNPANIVTKATEVIKLEFLGEGNFFKDSGTIQKYVTALLRLQLCDICELDKFICVFQDYYYHIYNQVPDTQGYLPLFFAKIPDPWGQKLIDTYNPGTNDTLGKRIVHCRDKMSEWCADAILAKQTRGLRKRISLCCNNPKMPLMIGCDSQFYYGKIKRKYKKRKQFKKRYFKKRKSFYYKKQKYKKPKTPMFRRNKKNPQECRCYYCKQIGHYANKCPKKFQENKKKIEIDEEIEKMIINGDFIQINNFEEVETDESIFILTETEYSETTEEENE